jgi:hypothetical protein
MKWVAKAALQQVFSHLPVGADANYAFQRWVTRTLPADRAAFDHHVGQAVGHWRRYAGHEPVVPPEEAAFYEFGAGWDLIGPLVLWGLGAQSQTLVDIRPNLRVALINHTLATYEQRRHEIGAAYSLSLRPAQATAITSVDELQRFGIRYLAPCDARSTGLPSNSIDCITSTYTLEHIPRPDILAILTESRRLLKPTGLLGSSIDLQDHYSYFDQSVSVYGYLRYAEPAWRVVNSPLHFQNRLRYPEYRDLFRQAGFDMVDEELRRPTGEELDELEGMKLADQFRGFTKEDLGVRSIYFLARPRTSA